MKIALVHDYLNEAGGAERVLATLAEMYPEAPIYTAFAKNGSAMRTLLGKDIRESKWAPLLKFGRMYSYLRFLLPFIWKSVDLTMYDTVITSCSGYIARGFKVKPDARVVAYCHTPPRWLYGYETPTGAQRSWWGQAFMWLFGPMSRYFDYKSAQRVNVWIANSYEVAKRIEKFYRKKAVVIYPACSALRSNEGRPPVKEDYYLLVSRIVGGKGVEQAIAGAKKAGVILKIVGERVGNIEIKKSKNIEYLGRVSDRELATLYSQARGFIALARDEDFGMTVVEAISHGTPVLAFYGGGYKETVKEGVNGWFVHETDPVSVAEGIVKMEQTKWKYQLVVESVSKFAKNNFVKQFKKVIGNET